MMLVAHLWQSTVCAGLAALLAASLAHAPGRVRHRIWLLASVKFLVPFSLLVSLGGTIGTWLPAADPASASVAVRWLDRSLPFWNLGALQRSGGDGLGFEVTRSFSLALTLLWVAGAVGLVWWRWRAWRALGVAARTATPLEHGREAEALRRAVRQWPRPRRIALLACTANVEPGLRGLLRPQVLWPTGLSDTLSDAELDAIMAHEVCHVHRHDNAFVVLQMIVETLLWFHPVVWWLGARLVVERERACDEEVLQMGADRRNYAEGILKVCRFCLGAPIACRVGAGAAPLAERIARIMEHRPAPGLPASARAIVASVGVLLVAAPLATGVLDARRRSVDVVDPRQQPSAAAAAPLATTPSADASEQTVYRLGEGITSPKLIKEAKPGYTRDAMRARIQGRVALEAVVLTDGTVGEVTVTRSLDKVYGLDKEAVKTVKLWRFRPGTKDGKAVPVRVELDMTFTLR